MMIARVLGATLTVGGISFLLLALVRVGRFRLRGPQSAYRPPATLLIPAHGLSPRLEECLRSIIAQRYPCYQVVFGLHAPDDPARTVIDRLMAEHPDIDMTLVVDGRRIGTNPKNCNLANMMMAVKHDLLVMVDSDVLVGPDFLATIAAPMDDPTVGGVTCLYKAGPQVSLAPRLAALYINDWFIPSALVDVSRQEMSICYGAAIATTRQTLDAIGGFAAMADAVAQDYVFAHRLRRSGYRIRLAPVVVETIIAEETLRSVIRHELRWNRAVRAVRPIDHGLSIFMNSLVPGVCLLFVSGAPAVAGLALATHLALRLALHRRLRRRISLPPARAWLLPLREALNFAVWLTALIGREVRWGETVLVTGDGLSMHQAHPGTSPPPGEASTDSRSLPG